MSFQDEIFSLQVTSVAVQLSIEILCELETGKVSRLEPVLHGLLVAKLEVARQIDSLTVNNLLQEVVH